MADPNTCSQCGVTNSNRTNITIRQSGKGYLVCQACYDKIHPEEKIIMDNIAKGIEPVWTELEDKNEPSLPSSKEKEEKGTIRSSSRRFPR